MEGKFKWAPYNKGGDFRRWYGNHEHLIWWEGGGTDIVDLRPRSVVRAQSHYFRESVSWLSYTISANSFRRYPSGFIFDTSAHSAFFESNEALEIALCLSNSKPFGLISSVINPTVHFHSANFMDAPYAHVAYRDVAQLSSALVAVSKNDWDAFETSWNFTTLPLLSADHRAESRGHLC